MYIFEFECFNKFVLYKVRDILSYLIFVLGILIIEVFIMSRSLNVYNLCYVVGAFCIVNIVTTPITYYLIGIRFLISLGI